MRRAEIPDRLQRNRRATLHRETEEAGANRGKRDRAKALLVRKFQRGSVGQAQFSILILLTASPHRADGMDDSLTRKFARSGQRRFVVSGQSMLPDPGVAFFLNFTPTAPDNRTRKSAAMRQMLVRGIHDRCHLFFSQITVIERERLAGGESELSNESCHRKIVTTKTQRYKGTKPRPTRSLRENRVGLVRIRP